MRYYEVMAALLMEIQLFLLYPVDFAARYTCCLLYMRYYEIKAAQLMEIQLFFCSIPWYFIGHFLCVYAYLSAMCVDEEMKLYQFLKSEEGIESSGMFMK